MKLAKFYRIDDDTVFMHTGPDNTGFLLSHDMPMVATQIDFDDYRQIDIDEALKLFLPRPLRTNRKGMTPAGAKALVGLAMDNPDITVQRNDGELRKAGDVNVDLSDEGAVFPYYIAGAWYHRDLSHPIGKNNIVDVGTPYRRLLDMRVVSDNKYVHVYDMGDGVFILRLDKCNAYYLTGDNAGNEAPVPNIRPMYYQDAIDTFKLIQEKEQGKLRKNNQPLFYMDTDDYICMIIPAVNMVINFNQKTIRCLDDCGKGVKQILTPKQAKRALRLFNTDNPHFPRFAIDKSESHIILFINRNTAIIMNGLHAGKQYVMGLEYDDIALESIKWGKAVELLKGDSE